MLHIISPNVFECARIASTLFSSLSQLLNICNMHVVLLAFSGFFYLHFMNASVCERAKKNNINSIIYLEHYLLALILSIREIVWASCQIHFGTAAPHKQVDMKSMIHSTWWSFFFWSSLQTLYESFLLHWTWLGRMSIYFLLQNIRIANGCIETLIQMRFNLCQSKGNWWFARDIWTTLKNFTNNTNNTPSVIS